MGQAVQLIEINLKKIKDVKDQCKVYDADIRSFEAELHFKAMELEITQLDYPMTVCADETCKKYVNIGKSRERNTVYQQVCHAHCHLSGVPVETTNNEQLSGCAAMSGGYCQLCSHNYRVHMHLTYTTNQSSREGIPVRGSKEQNQQEVQLKNSEGIIHCGAGGKHQGA